MNRFAWALLLLGLGACAGQNQQQSAGQSLKVTRAVLYQNGVGFFERRGKVDGQSLRFSVRSDQIGDVLKSLTVVDLAQGRPIAIGFPVEKSRARRLAELPPQVRGGGGIVALAEALRGARATVDSPSGSVTGRIVGLDRPPEGAKAAPRLSVLVDGGTLKQVPVDQIESLRLLDQTLEIGLQKSLDVALNDASWRPIPLEIRLDTKKEHDLVVSYVVEMPVWKPAYRLVFAEGGQVLLQGWAIVDNVSGEDWRDVDLSLVAGTPLAFTYDLYSPRYRRRADLTPAEDEVAMAPPEAEVGPAEESYAVPPPPPPPSAGAPAPADKADDMGGAGEGRMSKGKKKAGSRSRGPARPMAMPEAKAAEVTAEDLERNARSLAQGVAAGALFRYDIGAPVTVLDRESALVNIVNARVKGEDALLFRVGTDHAHPFRVAKFKNDTNLVLERGPIAIYRDGAFLGETVAARIDPGATSYVPYAQEPRVRLDLRTHDHEEAARLVRIVGGVITAETKLVTRHAYDIENKADEKLVLWVQREKRTNWKIADVSLEQEKKKDRGKAIEEGGRYYVPVTLEPRTRMKVTVAEETPARRTYQALDPIVRKTIAIYLVRPDANPRVAAQLREAIKLADEVADLDRRVDDLREQKDTLTERQTQVRENIKALAKVAGNADLKSKLHKSLAELEGKLGDVMKREILAAEERAAKRERLTVLLREISLEE